MGTAATADSQQNPSSRSMPPPAGSSRGARPLMSPTFSRKAFPPAEPASGSTAIVVSEPRRVTLDEWWLVKVEGHGKFGVAGFFERNGVVREFCAEPISKRYAPCTLETENGTILFLHGFFNAERAIQNGYTIIGKDPVGPSRKQRSTFIKSPHATRLPNIQSSIAHDNRLTRSRSKSLTAYSPEYLNLSKTKSGRVVVPALDSGCQNIVYNKDGSISAISGVDLQSPLKGTGSPLKVYTKKKRTN